MQLVLAVKVHFRTISEPCVGLQPVKRRLVDPSLSSQQFSPKLIQMRKQKLHGKQQFLKALEGSRRAVLYIRRVLVHVCTVGTEVTLRGATFIREIYQYTLSLMELSVDWGNGEKIMVQGHFYSRMMSLEGCGKKKKNFRITRTAE